MEFTEIEILFVVILALRNFLATNLNTIIILPVPLFRTES